MPVTLLASQCPAPVVESSYPTLTASENTTGTGIRVARGFSAGDTSTVPSKLNRNANALDLTATYGGGGFAIATGLAISAGSGLNISVAVGLAMIGGAVELSSAGTVAVTANHGTATDRVWIWLTQAGALSATTDTTPPATRCVCLGSCTTDASSVTAVDTSGVLYLKGGALWRETADAGPPGDSPSSTLTLFTKTAGGVFFWDTTAHRPVYEPLRPNKTTLTNESLTIEDTEQVILYGGLTLSGTAELVISGTGELIIL